MATPKTIAPKNSGAHASTKPWGWNPKNPDRNPFWKISRPIPNAPATDSAVMATPSAAIRGAWRAMSSNRNPSTSVWGRVHKLDFADDQGSCTAIGIEYHHWCYRVSTLVPWLGSDGSADASSLARGPDDVFGTHRLSAANSARSAGRYLGRPIWRRSTATS